MSKPSDGLEPSTRSLPWRSRRGNRVHGRSFARTLVLQIRRYECVGSAHACPAVLSLMYPSRTREPLSVLKTHNQSGLRESARSVPSGEFEVADEPPRRRCDRWIWR